MMDFEFGDVAITYVAIVEFKVVKIIMALQMMSQMGQK